MKQSFRLIIPAVIFGMAISIPAIAQDDSSPTSRSMHQAGEEMEQADSDATAAAVDAYHGTKRAVKDTAITAKVKTALHNDRTIGDANIDIDTRAGVVTLLGKVPSRLTAERVAMQTEGVRRVNDQLTVMPIDGPAE